MTFGADTTTDEVLAGLDLSGRTYLVTGASAGLGVETTRALAAHGARVVLAVRDLDKARAAADRVRATVPGADLELREVDLASLASVRAFGEAFAADHDQLDGLIANAGIMACPFGRTVDGWELQFGTNHLGHFLLLQHALPALLASADGGRAPRVVALSSAGHRYGAVDLDDPNFEATAYDPWVAYGRAKTANSLMAVGVDQRFADRGLRANAVHPGVIHTELARHLDDEALAGLMARIQSSSRPSEERTEAPAEGAEARPRRSSMKSVEAGAATSIYAACHPDLDGIGGRYLEDCRLAEVVDDPQRSSGVRSYALDPAIADALWDRSLGWVGLA